MIKETKHRYDLRLRLVSFLAHNKHGGIPEDGDHHAWFYCSTQVGLNLGNFEIITGGLSHTAGMLSISDTSV